MKNAIIILITFMYALMLGACAKSAPEVATGAVLAQISAVEQTIKKECPRAKIDDDMKALRASVNTQLKTCEARIETVESQRNTWVVVSGGLALVMLTYFLGKAHKIV